MPQIEGGASGENVQSITVHSPPAAPYLLTAVIPLATINQPVRFGVRNGAPATNWFPTEYERIARIEGIDYWEIRATITSGVATSFPVDRLTDPMLPDIEDRRDPQGVLVPHTPPDLIDPDALETLLRENAISLEIQNILDSSFARVSITGGFDTEGNRLWQSLRQHTGAHRYGRLMRTYYKHLPFRAGGSYGYLHIFATVMPYTNEIQWDINWHNGGIEERRGQGGSILGGPGNTSVPPEPFGRFRGANPVLFNRVKIIFAQDLISEGWIWSQRFADPAASIAANALVRQVALDQNRLHCLPITFERPFHFATHKTGTTPYLKHIIGVADWTRDLGGWAFQPIGLPSASVFSPAIDLAAEATACKTEFAAARPWHVEGSGQQGAIPSNFLWPASGSQYGGETGGIGMWPLYGSKLAITGQKAALEILLVEMARARSRCYGALYYNISGHPVIAQDHAPGGSGPWRRFDRRFSKTSQGVQDAPFRVTAQTPRMDLASYNPGPIGFTQGLSFEGLGDATPNVPDWYVTPLAGDLIQAEPLPVDLALLLSGGVLAHTDPPPITLNHPDQSVPVILQVAGAGAFNASKSITVEITGTGATDLPLVESFTLVGSAESPTPTLQSKLSVGAFKTVTSAKITAIVGTLLSTELVSVGRAAVGVYDYSGPDGWTAIDDQHYTRVHPINRTLFLIANHPIAKLYCLMDGANARMTFWEGTGQAQRLSEINNGSPGHGMQNVRELAWYVDCIASTIAISHGLWNPPLVDFWWNNWRQKCANMFRNAQMTNFGFVAKGGAKEFKRVPYGTRSDEEEGSQVFWGASSREMAYFMHALLMLTNVFGHHDADLEQRIKNVGIGYRDWWWHVANSEGPAPHVFLPVALHFNPPPPLGDGQIRNPDLGHHPQGTWVVYATQADLPATNPISGCLIRPAVYPPVDDDRFVAPVTSDTIIEGTPLTLANTTADAAMQPAPVEIKVIDSGTPSSARRTGIFDISGTNPLGQAVSSHVYVDWLQGQTKTFRNGAGVLAGQHFKTISSIVLRVGSKTGVWPVNATIRAGVGRTGLRFDVGASVWPTYSEAYQLPYALAVIKVVSDKLGDSSAIDTCIRRYCGSGGVPAADLAACKAAMETWDEYSGGPTGRMEQWLTLLWALRAS